MKLDLGVTETESQFNYRNIFKLNGSIKLLKKEKEKET